MGVINIECTKIEKKFHNPCNKVFYGALLITEAETGTESERAINKIYHTFITKVSL